MRQPVPGDKKRGQCKRAPDGGMRGAQQRLRWQARQPVGQDQCQCRVQEQVGKLIDVLGPKAVPLRGRQIEQLPAGDHPHLVPEHGVGPEQRVQAHQQQQRQWRHTHQHRSIQPVSALSERQGNGGGQQQQPHEVAWLDAERRQVNDGSRTQYRAHAKNRKLRAQPRRHGRQTHRNEHHASQGQHSGALGSSPVGESVPYAHGSPIRAGRTGLRALGHSSRVGRGVAARGPWNGSP